VAEPKPRDVLGRVGSLPPRSERPDGCRTTDESNELAPSHCRPRNSAMRNARLLEQLSLRNGRAAKRPSRFHCSLSVISAHLFATHKPMSAISGHRRARPVTLNVKCLFQIGASATAVRLGGGSKWADRRDAL